MADLPDAEREALERAKRERVSTTPGPSFAEGWLAARAYFGPERDTLDMRATMAEEALETAEGRKRLLREALAPFSGLPVGAEPTSAGLPVAMYVRPRDVLRARAALAASPGRPDGVETAPKRLTPKRLIPIDDETREILENAAEQCGLESFGPHIGPPPPELRTPDQEPGSGEPTPLERELRETINALCKRFCDPDCDECEDGIYEEGDEWSPCEKCVLGPGEPSEAYVLVFCDQCGEMLGAEDHLRIRAEHLDYHNHRGLRRVTVAALREQEGKQ